mmetsp:Transcript_29387/g.55490  ORF Transcript_29387/g.55490 Transcript_29387/m.55490 type:complete len:246 (-) Transcript_29387:1084-1821(-)
MRPARSPSMSMRASPMVESQMLRRRTHVPAVTLGPPIQPLTMYSQWGASQTATLTTRPQRLGGPFMPRDFEASWMAIMESTEGSPLAMASAAWGVSTGRGSETEFPVPSHTRRKPKGAFLSAWSVGLGITAVTRQVRSPLTVEGSMTACLFLLKSSFIFSMLNAFDFSITVPFPCTNFAMSDQHFLTLVASSSVKLKAFVAVLRTFQNLGSRASFSFLIMSILFSAPSSPTLLTTTKLVPLVLNS